MEKSMKQVEREKIRKKRKEEEHMCMRITIWIQYLKKMWVITRLYV
jgi:hypothetical protein